MSRTRSPTLYPQKRAMLLEVAQRLFLKHGYDGTSMSKLADEAEVAPNTLYWYFADKDALLVEVLKDRMFRMVPQYVQRMSDPLEAQLLWLVGVLEEVRPLASTVHARAAISPAVAEWHEQFHTFLEAQFLEQLRKRGIPPKKRKSTARIVMFVVEGMISHACTQAEREELVKFLVELAPAAEG